MPVAIRRVMIYLEKKMHCTPLEPPFVRHRIEHVPD